MTKHGKQKNHSLTEKDENLDKRSLIKSRTVAMDKKQDDDRVIESRRVTIDKNRMTKSNRKQESDRRTEAP
jgi:hypothetical protein